MWFPMAPKPMNPIVLALSVGPVIMDDCEKRLWVIKREIEGCEELKVRLPCRLRGRECRGPSVFRVCRMMLEACIFKGDIENQKHNRRMMN